MEVEPDGQREATVPGRTEPDARGDARISGIQVASAGHPQQRGLETRSVADGEQLLRIAARTAIAAQFDGDGQLHVKPAVDGTAVSGAAAFDDRLGGVENPVHADSFPLS